MEIRCWFNVCVHVCVCVFGIFYFFIFLNISAPSVLCDRFTHLSWGGLHSQFRRKRRQVTAMASAPYLCNMTTVNLTSLDM